MAVCLMAAAAFLTGCSKELDDLESPVVGTEASGNSDETDGDVLRIQVSDAGFRDGKTGSRATDSGLNTTFEEGDKIGLFVVNSENEILYANVSYTKSGADWTATQNIRTKGYPVRVFAYYPYVKDAEITGKVDATAQDVSTFFKTYIEGLDISNQSTQELYRQADVMACMVTVDNKEAAREKLTLSMSHLLGQVVVKLPTEVTLSSVNCYLKDESYTWTAHDITFPANLSKESLMVTGGIQPLKEETGYRYLCRYESGKNNISFSGGFTTYEAEKGYSVSNATISAGSSKTYNVSVTPFAAPGKAEYTPQVGDFYMNDGRVLSSISEDDKANCIGIVYWVPTATDPLENYSPKWLGDYTNCTHGLVVGLKETSSKWSDDESTLVNRTGTVLPGFAGYSSTQTLITNYSKYAIVSTYNKLASDVFLPDDKTSSWFIPGVRELLALRKIYKKVNTSLDFLGTTKFASDGAYWSSEDYLPGYTNTVGISYGTAGYEKPRLFLVRLVFAF